MNPDNRRRRLLAAESRKKSIPSQAAEPNIEEVPTDVVPARAEAQRDLHTKKATMAVSGDITDPRLAERAAVHAEEQANPDFRQEAVGTREDISDMFTGETAVPFEGEDTAEVLAMPEDTTGEAPLLPLGDHNYITPHSPQDQVIAPPELPVVQPSIAAPIMESSPSVFSRITNRLGKWGKRLALAFSLFSSDQTTNEPQPMPSAQVIDTRVADPVEVQAPQTQSTVSQEAAAMRTTLETAIKAGEGVSQAIKRLGNSDSVMNALLTMPVKIGDHTNALLYSYVDAKPDQLGMRVTMNGLNEIHSVEFYDTANPTHTLDNEELEQYLSFQITDAEKQLHTLEDTLDSEGEGFELSRYPLEFRLDPLAASSGEAQASVQVRHMESNQFITCTPELLDALQIDVTKWKRSVGFGKNISLEQFEQAAKQ